MYFKEQLQKQLGFLQSSSEAYDKGNTDEGIRIATSLRVLFHQTAQSTSLIRHLHADKIRLVSSCEPIPSGAGFWANLTTMEIRLLDEIARFNPKLDTAASRRLVRLHEWWNTETVYLVRPITFSRRSLVLSATNKDGGAHVDATLGANYEMLSRQGAAWSLTLNPDGKPSKTLNFEHAHVAALRHMAFEVLNSPEIVNLAK
ncbi:MAG TPA: hypothetical protein VGK19_18270 [Capsulimonadaceae bacterium]|jgi:hypothetical protein